MTEKVQFQLRFVGAESFVIDAPHKDIDGLDELGAWLSMRKWFYSNGRLINTQNIQWVTLLKESSYSLNAMSDDR